VTSDFRLKRSNLDARRCSHRYPASPEEHAGGRINRPFPGLGDFREKGSTYSRNSYRCRKYHIYETVKLNQIELITQFDYSESEKRFKAFTEHDLV
jgi:hypothetical protein